MKTHPLHVGYLVSGLVFLGAAAVWALREAQLVELDDVRWLLPLMLVLAGVLGLVAFAARNVRPRGAVASPPDPSPDPELDRPANSSDHEGQVR